MRPFINRKASWTLALNLRPLKDTAWKGKEKDMITPAFQFFPDSNN